MSANYDNARILPLPALNLAAARLPARLEELDSLRGLAALTVVISHHLIVLPVFFNPTNWHGHIPVNILKYTPLHLLFAGHEAVILFFVLSGFVLSLPFHANKQGPYASFVIRRICRIYLPYIVSVAAAVIMCRLLSRGGIPELSPWLNLRWCGGFIERNLIDHAFNHLF